MAEKDMRRHQEKLRSQLDAHDVASAKIQGNVKGEWNTNLNYVITMYKFSINLRLFYLAKVNSSCFH